MIKGKRMLAGITAALVATGVFASAIAVPQTAYAETNGASQSSQAQKVPSRLYGKDRYETAAAISKYGWTQSDYIVLANGEVFADALCAAPLAKALNAPILLTAKDGLSESAKNEITRLRAKHVYIIGKEGAVSSETEKNIEILGADVKRLGGVSRYETSALVAEEIQSVTKTPVSSVALVYGEGFADALSIAPIAAEKGMPILLTETDKLPAEIAKFLQDNKASIKDTYVIGGQTLISEEVAKAAASNRLRLWGSDRYETNAKILSWFKDSLKFDNVYVVEGDGPRGDEFADALSAAALAVKSNSPVILTNGALSDKLSGFLKNIVNSSTQITALGGTAAVPQSIVDSLNAIAAANQAEGQVPPGAGAATGTAGGASDPAVINDLRNISGKLNTISSQVNTSSEKSIVTQIQNSINKVLSDPSYNCSTDAAGVKALYKNLSEPEKTDLKNKIQANLDINMLLKLAAIFGI